MKEYTLNLKIRYLNEMLGTPLQTYSRSEDGNLTSNIGNHSLYHCTGVWAVHMICNEQGGTQVVLHASTKAALFDLLDAYMKGYAIGFDKGFNAGFKQADQKEF